MKLLLIIAVVLIVMVMGVVRDRFWKCKHKYQAWVGAIVIAAVCGLLLEWIGERLVK